MDLVAHFEVMNPPTKYVHTAKRKYEVDDAGEVILDKEGNPKLKTTTYYLTANLFYGGNVHWSMMRKATNHAKDSILPFLHTVPKMEKCRLEIIYHHPNAQFDLDNKVYFWTKMILDLFTPPTEKEKEYAEEYNRPIKSIYALDDDSVKYIDDIHMKYQRGEHKLEVKVFGRLYCEQGSLF